MRINEEKKLYDKSYYLKHRERNKLRAKAYLQTHKILSPTNQYSTRAQARQIVEETINKKLPRKARVHHVDGDPFNNRKDNLVACESESYHRLLHIRASALEECGDPNKRKCCYCKQWDDQKNMSQGYLGAWFHYLCKLEYGRIYYHKRKEAARAH